MKKVLVFKEISNGRYREEHGLFFDDFDVGDVIEHRPGRTITEVDNIWQSLINMNTHPLHIDSEYGKETEFGRNLVSSLVSLSIVGGLTANTLSAKAVANLGWNYIKLLKPLYVGDTVYAETEVIDKRLSQSREGTGIVTFKTFGIKGDGTQFMVFERNVLIPLRGYSASKNSFYQ